MERLKVLLLNPPVLKHVSENPVIAPPLELTTLAGVMEHSFDVKILDCIAEGIEKKNTTRKEVTLWGVDYDELALRISRWEPNVVGIYVDHPSQEEVVYEVARVYKKHADIRKVNIIVVPFGPYASFATWDLMKHKEVDFVVVGEPEIPFFELCRALESGIDCSTIDGIAFRDYTGGIMVNPHKEYVEDLNQLPFPARHLILVDKYRASKKGFKPTLSPFVNIFLTRGCEANCSFCSIPAYYGGKFRSRSVENVIGELEYLVKHYHIKEFYIEDSNFLKDQDFALEFCQKLKAANLNLRWSCPDGITAWGYNHNLLKAMAESGCYYVCLNIESGSDRVLSEVINSPQVLDIIYNLIPDLKEVGIHVGARFRIGYPGEKREDILKTYELISEFNFEHYTIEYIEPVPGTPLWETCRKKDLFFRPVSGRDFLIEPYLLKTEHFGPEELRKIREDGEKIVWRKQAVTNPGVILKAVGGFFDRVLLHPFTSKDKKKRR